MKVILNRIPMWIFVDVGVGFYHVFIMYRFLVCLSGWNFIIDFKLTSWWARFDEEVDDNEWKYEKRRKKRKRREKDEENEKDENKKLN